MPDQEIMIARRWFEEIWNRGRTEVIDELLAPGARFHGLGASGEVVQGPDGFRAGYEQLKGAFPDIQFTIDEAISERDLVALRWTARMTHKGDHLGVPATDKPVVISGMSFARILDGKAVVEVWNSWDMIGMMSQIGQLPHARVLPSS